MTLEIEYITKLVLREINELRLSQREVSKTLAIAIKTYGVDWRVINNAIVNRWKGRTARERILTMAWNIVEGKTNGN